MAERPIVRMQREAFAGGLVGASSPQMDAIADEAPLVLRARGTQVLTLLRTPGHDEELVAGLLHGEGLPPAPMVRLGDDIVDIDTDAGRFVARPLVATGACGACSKAMIAELQLMHGASPQRQYGGDGEAPPFVVARDAVSALPARLVAAQLGFAASGGLHAAALCDEDGAILVLREDVGRHNAVDKVVGWAVLAKRLPLRRTILMLSGRVGFELVAKAAAAGIELVAAISAPTTLAVDAALRSKITLCGFVRDGRFNVYAHPERIA